MRSLAATTACLFAAAVAISSGAQASPADISPAFAGHATALQPGTPDTVLFSSMNDFSGVGIASEAFLHKRKKYTSRSADDFSIAVGSTWTINEVDVVGLYRDVELATSENVFFYADNDGMPGAVLKKFTHLHAADDASGDFQITLDQGGITLPKGTYWISVQIVMAGSTFWVWETTDDLHGNASVFRNPRDGYGTGCRTYQVMQTCAGDLGEGPDFVFALQGTIS